MWGEGRGGAGVCPEGWLGWLRWPAHHLMVLGVGHTHGTLFCSSEVSSGFFIFLYLVVHNLPPIHLAHSYF